MKARQIASDSTPEDLWVLVFDTGEEVVELLTRFALQHNLDASHFTGIGGFQEVVLGYFDFEKKEYRRIPMKEQVELLSLTGTIARGADGPQSHAHAVVGCADGSTRGGHLLQARVRPTLELVISEAPLHLSRRYDPETGLALLDPSASAH